MPRSAGKKARDTRGAKSPAERAADTRHFKIGALKAVITRQKKRIGELESQVAQLKSELESRT